MASKDFLLATRIGNQLLQNIAKRNISKSSQKPKVQGGHYRLWAMPGDSVVRREVLARQSSIKWHPGLNAGINDDKTIYALCDGVLVITEDKFDPDWSHPLVNYIYTDKDEKMAPFYKRYIHVIPNKRISEFKLIDLV